MYAGKETLRKGILYEHKKRILSAVLGLLCTASLTAAPFAAMAEEITETADTIVSEPDVTAAETPKEDGTLYMTIIDDKDSVIESYIIDPKTGTGTDSKDNAVNLPQTGNNALTNLILTFGAFLTTIAGGIAVGASGVFRRRKDQK